jgi:hypothetical protein
MLHMPSRSDTGSCLASGDAAQAGLPDNSLKPWTITGTCG